MKLLSSENLKKIFLFALILAVVFGYDDGSEKLILFNWIANFLIIYIICLISSFVKELSHIIVAYWQGCSLELKLISLRRYHPSTSSYSKRPIKIGAIIPILITLLSNGLLYFPAVSSYEVKEERHLRLGKKFQRLSEWELAKIAAAGPIASILLAVIFNMFNFSFLSVSPVVISQWIAIINILPIPLLNGYNVFIHSRLLFFFSFVFILLLALSLSIMNSVLALILSIIFAFILLFVYMLYPNIKK